MTVDDDATRREEQDRELALKMRKPELKPVGACYWCGEMCRGVFCSPECREDHVKHERFNR